MSGHTTVQMLTTESKLFMESYYDSIERKQVKRDTEGGLSGQSQYSGCHMLTVRVTVNQSSPSCIFCPDCLL